MTAAGVAFGTALFLIAYPLVVYPAIVLLLGSIRRNPVRREEIAPTVSLLITAYNEEDRIARKLDNTLALDYPADRLQILVCSDAGTDRTDEIAAEYADRGVELVRLPHRGGKSLAQNAGLRRATGDVIVHTDATTELPANALRMIVRPLADPTVGCVTSQDRSVPSELAEGGGVETAGAYTRYEIAVRNAEAAMGSLIGVSGSFYAVRRSLRPPLAPEVIDDLYVPLWVVRNGLRVVPEPDAVGIVRRSGNVTQEYPRKVRTFLGGMVALFRASDMLNPLRFGQTSWQLFSHKIARWLLPLWLAVLFAANVVLAGAHPLFALSLAGQIVFWITALLGRIAVRLGYTPIAPVRAVYYFAMVNVALLDAWLRLLRGERQATWEPTRR